MIGILLQKGRQEHREHGPQAATGYAATGYAATLRPELPRRRRRKTARTRVSCSTPRATLSWIGTHPASDKPLDRNSISLMRMLANRTGPNCSQEHRGVPLPRPVNCSLARPLPVHFLCFSTEQSASAELYVRGHGPRAEAIVAHLTARFPLVNGAELGLRFDSMS